MTAPYAVVSARRFHPSDFCKAWGGGDTSCGKSTAKALGPTGQLTLLVYRVVREAMCYWQLPPEFC